MHLHGLKVTLPRSRGAPREYALGARNYVAHHAHMMRCACAGTPPQPPSALRINALAHTHTHTDSQPRNAIVYKKFLIKNFYSSMYSCLCAYISRRRSRCKFFNVFTAKLNKKGSVTPEAVRKTRLYMRTYTVSSKIFFCVFGY